MIIYTLFTALCLAVLLAECGYVIFHLIRKNHSQRVFFLRKFKKGKCAYIYATILPLLFMGHLYAGRDIMDAFFLAIHKSINLVVLIYETTSISGLKQDNLLYAITNYLCFIMIGINALLLTASLLGQQVWARWECRNLQKSQAGKLILIGSNPENVSILESDKKREKILLDKLTDKEQETYYANKILFANVASDKSITEALAQALQNLDSPLTVVINTKDDQRNISLCQSLLAPIGQLPDNADAFLRFQVFVFGDPRFETIYADLMRCGKGCIHYVNKYQLVAMDFIDKYPLTRFMTRQQLNTQTSLIEPDADLNVLFIGFGKTNQQIFLTSVANNQFLTVQDDQLRLKQVHYHLFDKETSDNDKNLNHNYYRYKNELPFLQGTYLELPQEPATLTNHILDINDHIFYRQIHDIVCNAPQDLNAVIIAFGSDLENIDMAQKLLEKRAEWGVDNLQIFVKARTYRKSQTLLADDNCFFIGYEKDVVYNIDKLTGDSITCMARSRNQLYDIEYAITESRLPMTNAQMDICRLQSTRDWFQTKSQLERESSLYCCLSLRSKLQMMGLDYCPAGDPREGLSPEAYLQIYAGEDLPKYLDIQNQEKPIVDYQLPFLTSRRGTMAVQEHYRWNSYMISKGFIPASVEQIITETNAQGRFTNGKRYDLRRHGNLTTMEGLVQFRNIRVKRDQCAPIQADVIKYDYQILDDAYWLLKANGYKIVKKS